MNFFQYQLILFLSESAMEGHLLLLVVVHVSDYGFDYFIIICIRITTMILRISYTGVFVSVIREF